MYKSKEDHCNGGQDEERIIVMEDRMKRGSM
jgi:hypothetical protein